MLKKTFLQTQFGDAHPWTEKYFQNVKMLAPYGWNLIVFTPNSWPSSENIQIVPMTLEEFDGLIQAHCGVDPKNYLSNGVPAKLVSDYYPAYGAIFQDYIHDVDFWAISNWDICYGRLDHFIPDSVLEQVDIWSDDVNAINGIFTLFRNNEYVNNLFRQVPDWETSFTVHEPCAFDEIQFTKTVRESVARGELRFGYPPYFGYHSYDRLIQHQPKPNLYFEEDGALIERYDDRTHFPARRPWFGREIAMFHFSRSKRYPDLKVE